LAVLAGLGIYALGAPTAWMYASTRPYRLTVDTVPAAPVALVLGAGLEGGRPSPFLAGRLRTTVDLYHRGKVRVILVTGDNSRKGYDEPSAMRDFLVANGVPAERIVLDYAGFDTWDSCARAKEIFGVDRAIVVTQQFHLPRAVALCRSVGIAAYGVGHDSYPLDHQTTEYGYAREVIASIKAIGDLVGHPRPHFLGPREPGVQRALAG
jgi:vancomycin permeability regulator SanA